jgi:hypothetical protein
LPIADCGILFFTTNRDDEANLYRHGNPKSAIRNPQLEGL